MWNPYFKGPRSFYVIDIDFTAPKGGPNGSVTLYQQYLFDSHVEPMPVARGDSGSFLMTDEGGHTTNEVTSLYHAAFPRSRPGMREPEWFGVATPIGFVMEALDVSILEAEPAAEPLEPRTSSSLGELEARVEQDLCAREEGARLFTLWSDLKDELTRLIKTDKKVATVYIRGEGLAILTQYYNWLIDPNARMPETLESGTDVFASLRALGDVLKAYGSEAIRERLEEAGPPIRKSLGKTYREFLAALD